MKKQIIILRLISGLLFVTAIMPFAGYWGKANPEIITYISIYSLFPFIVAVGLLRRYDWARWLAIALLTIGLARSIVGAYDNIQLMADRYDVTARVLLAGAPLWIFIAASMLWAVIAASIWWLAKSSTKELFSSKW